MVTETGVENFTAFLPTELDAIEAIVRQKGVLQAVPAPTEAGFEALRGGAEVRAGVLAAVGAITSGRTGSGAAWSWPHRSSMATTRRAARRVGGTG